VSTAPLISVVIPTLGRSQLLMRALAGVFAQTCRDIEVVVVVDGPDEATLAALRMVGDPRLRVIANPRSLTAAGARNAGVAAAAGRWIAFLDDDDEWLPQKLERQLAVAGDRVLVGCLSQVVTPLASYVWPETIYDNAIPIDEYLFDRKSAFAGGSFIQTSSYFMPRALYQASPFRLGTPHDDWDFLLRLTKQAGARIEIVPEVLAKIHFEDERPSLSKADGWAVSLAWIDGIRPLLTPRAYSGFCLGVVGPRAAREGAYAAFLPLLRRAWRDGAPRPLHVAAFLAFWLIPQTLRRRLRAALRGQRVTLAPPQRAGAGARL
jgi:glycosyltransferase involved in cell wall biosynthesis